MTVTAPEDGDFLDIEWAEQVTEAINGLLVFQASIVAIGTYTPVWTGAGGNPAIVNGTITGRYCKIGNVGSSAGWGLLQVAQSMGSGTTYGSGIWSWSLPADWTAAASALAGWGQILDAGTKRYPAAAYLSDTTHVQLTQPVAAGDGSVTPTLPHTWASGDQLSFGMIIPLA